MFLAKKETSHQMLIFVALALSISCQYPSLKLFSSILHTVILFEVLRKITLYSVNFAFQKYSWLMGDHGDCELVGGVECEGFGETGAGVACGELGGLVGASVAGGVGSSWVLRVC